MKTLDSLGYFNHNNINDVNKIEINLKSHLERLNSDELNIGLLSNEEFKIYVLNKIENNTIFQNSQLFRDYITINRGQNENIRLKCFDKINL